MEDAASGLAGFDFDDLGFLDGLLKCFDLDLPAGFGGGDSCQAEPGKEGDLGLDLGSPDDGGRESSPDSVVTDDGAPSLDLAGDHGNDSGSMSAYVSDLERFLMEDSDADEACRPMAAEEGLGADEFFLSDYFVANDGCAEPAAGTGVDFAETMGAEEELAADDYFLDDYYVEDHGYAIALPAVEDAMAGAKEEEPATDDYCFDDFFVADDDGCAEPASCASVVDPASPALEEEEEDLAAREDEAISRKRAREEYKLAYNQQKQRKSTDARSYKWNSTKSTTAERSC